MMAQGVHTPPDIKALAIQLARETSAAEVERRMGIDESTVGKWLAADSILPNDDRTAAYWSEWKQHSALKAAEAVDIGLDLAIVAGKEGDSRKFHQSMMGTGIAIDKVMSLIGHAVARAQAGITVNIDVGYSEAVSEFARIEALRSVAIEAASSRDAPTSIEGAAVTDQ